MTRVPVRWLGIAWALTIDVTWHHALPLTRRSSWHGLSLVGILAWALLILTIPAGRRVFWWDEARVALLAQDILDHGHWVVRELREKLYLNKPQLHFWTVALVSIPVGRVTELTAGIPAVLSLSPRLSASWPLTSTIGTDTRLISPAWTPASPLRPTPIPAPACC